MKIELTKAEAVHLLEQAISQDTDYVRLKVTMADEEVSREPVAVPQPGKVIFPKKMREKLQTSGNGRKWSAERRAAHAEKMRRLHAEGKLGRKKRGRPLKQAETHFFRGYTKGAPGRERLVDLHPRGV